MVATLRTCPSASEPDHDKALDGSVEIPEKLVPYMGGLTKIEKA